MSGVNEYFNPVEIYEPRNFEYYEVVLCRFVFPWDFRTIMSLLPKWQTWATPGNCENLKWSPRKITTSKRFKF